MYSDKLDIFKVPKTDVSEVASKLVTVYPKSILSDNGPLEFEFSSPDFIDLSNSELCLRARMCLADGSDLKQKMTTGDVVIEGNYPAPVNNWFHSMFQNCNFTIAGQEMEAMYNLYAYTAYFNALLNESRDDQETKLFSQFWAKDNWANMDWTWSGDPQSDANKKAMAGGAYKRMDAHFGRRQTGIWISGRPSCDMFRQKKYIPPNTTVRLRLLPQLNGEFGYLYPGTEKIQTQIKEAFLQMRTVRAAPEFTSVMSAELRDRAAQYAISRRVSLPFTIRKDETNVVIQDPTRGRKPSKLVIGFVKETAFNGSAKLNPFNFEELAIRSVQLYLNGETVRDAFTRRPLINFQSMFEHGSCNITYEEYWHGYSLLAFYPTPNGGDQDLSMPATTQLVISFETAPTENYKAIVYFECDDTIEISPKTAM